MDKQKHYAIYWLDSHQKMGVRQGTWGNKGAEKRKGERKREIQGERKLMDCKQELLRFRWIYIMTQNGQTCPSAHNTGMWEV